MKDIQINLFSTTDRRLPIAFGHMDQMSKIKPELLDKSLLKVFCYKLHEEQWKKKLATTNIPYEICAMRSPEGSYTGYDYKERTNICLQSPSKYSVRIDDDLFMSAPLWNFLLGTMDEVLSQERVHAYTPMFSTGMPHIDWFVEDFMTDTEKATIREMFRKHSVPAKPWFPQCDYTHLQKLVEKMDKWDTEAWWKEVLTGHNTPFQSIHPIRFSAEANAYLMERIFANFDKILEEQEYECMALTGYPCSHWTCTRTETWKQAVAEFGPIDPFDELSMQCTERKHGRSIVYIRKGFAIHPCHGYVPDREKIDEKYAEFIGKL